MEYLNLVKREGFIPSDLKSIPSEFHTIELYTEAVKNNWKALQYVSRENLEFMAYFDLCMLAVKKEGLAIRLVSSEVRDGPIIGYFLRREAIKQNPKAKKYIDISDISDLNFN